MPDEPSPYTNRNDLVYNVRAAARALGGDVIGRNSIAAPGPGHSTKDRSLTIKFISDAPDGFVVFSHASDSWSEARDHVRAKLGLPAWRPGNGHDRHVRQTPRLERTIVDTASEQHITEEDRPRIERAVAIWNQAIHPRGTKAELYLASRKLVLGDDVANNVLRFHPAVAWRNENTGQDIYIPALIAAFRSIDDNTITAVHRIRLDQPERWLKAERKMRGVIRRAAVKLAPINSTLHIGEGVETCLAAQQLGYAPAWALGSTSGITYFPLINDVTCLRILGETGEASAEAIKVCGNRWHRAGRRVQFIMPDIGSDLNDDLMAVAAATTNEHP